MKKCEGKKKKAIISGHMTKLTISFYHLLYYTCLFIFFSSAAGFHYLLFLTLIFPGYALWSNMI